MDNKNKDLNSNSELNKIQIVTPFDEIINDEETMDFEPVNLTEINNTDNLNNICKGIFVILRKRKLFFY